MARLTRMARMACGSCGTGRRGRLRSKYLLFRAIRVGAAVPCRVDRAGHPSQMSHARPI